MCDPSELFELAQEALDPVTILLELGLAGRLNLFGRTSVDDDLGSGRATPPPG